MPHDALLLRLSEMISAYWVSQSVYVAAKLGLADLLHSGPKSAEEMAATTGTHAESLARLLRALASVGVFASRDGIRWEMTPLAEGLRSDVPGSQRAMAIMNGEEHFQAWGQLLYSIQTGQGAFRHLFKMPVFDYLAQHPEQAKTFDAAMTGVHGRETSVMLQAYDFSQFGTLMDVGGGNGTVLMAVLRACPKVQGVLFDLPHVVERSQVNIKQAGLAERCRAVGGDFFRELPRGADAIVMRHIIHDWTDEQCQTILRNCRSALPPHGKVLIVESVIPPGNDPFFGKLLDLTMLVIPEGKERTAAEYEALLASAGLRLSRIVPTASEISVIEAVME